MSRRRLGALAAPLMVLSACATQGALDRGGEAARTLRASPDVLAEAGTVAFEARWTASGDGQEIEHTTVGQRDLDAERLTMEVRSGGGLAELLEPIRVIVTGGTAYLRAPMLDELTRTSGWLAAPSPPRAAPLGILVDPTAVLEVLRGVTGPVVALGHEAVRGIRTTHLAATVAVDAAAAHVPDARRSAMRAQLDQLGVGDATVPVEIWIDAAGFARRLVLDLSRLAGAEADGGPASSMAIELFDHGRPVAIDAPPVAETTPYGEAMASLAQTFLEAGA